MSQKYDIATLRSLPKVDLHRHLEGALRLETLWEFHCRQTQRFHDSLESLQRACTVPHGHAPGFRNFLACFDGLRFKYGGLDALSRLAAECVEDAAADGVIHLELRFSPAWGARRLKEFPPGALPPPDSLEEVEAAAGATIAGAMRQAEKSGIAVSFILCLGRHFGWEANRSPAELLHRPIGKHFCGIDLAGDESHPARAFQDAFKEWKAAGRGVTIHAGEDPAGPGAANVIEAIDSLGADRIGHGLRAQDDSAVISRLIERRTTLEMCPLSNVQTKACSDFKSHPLKSLLLRGVAVTINTDDPSISNTTLSQEYAHALNDCELSFHELSRCAVHAARAAFLPEPEKSKLVARVTAAWNTHAGS